MADNNGAMVVREERALDPRQAVAARNLDDVRRMATAIAKSGLYACKSIEEAEIRIITGMELGLSMMQSIRGVYVISTGGKNMPGLYADLMTGVCKSRNDVCEYFRLVKSDEHKATYATKRVGEPSETEMSFTMEDAKRAGLLSKAGPWSQYPAAMLRARASSALARAVYPDLLNGLYSTEELQDMRDTPQPVPVTAERVTVDGGIVLTPELDFQLHQALEAQQTKVFEDLMVALLDARSPPALDAAMAAVGAAKDKLSAEQLKKLREGAKEMKKVIASGDEPFAP